MKKMKKIATMAMAGGMILGMSSGAFAANLTESDGTWTGDTSGDATIIVPGQINREMGIDIDIETPANPIDLTIPTGAAMWWVPSADGQDSVWDGSSYGDASTTHSPGLTTVAGEVISPAYQIINNGANHLAVTLTDFDTNDAALDTASGIGNLDLSVAFTGGNDVTIQVIDGAILNANGSLGILEADDAWTYEFIGEWSGNFYETELMFDHSMVLNFAVTDLPSAVR